MQEFEVGYLAVVRDFAREPGDGAHGKFAYHSLALGIPSDLRIIRIIHGLGDPGLHRPQKSIAPFVPGYGKLLVSKVGILRLQRAFIFRNRGF